MPDINIMIPPPRLPLTEAERQQAALEIYRECGIDVFQDFPGGLELEIVHAVAFPHESLAIAYESGCAEPWTSQLVTSLLIASNQRVVLETGGFTGQTSAWLALALERLGGGELIAVDIEAERALAIQNRLEHLPLPNVNWRVVNDDILKTIPTFPDQSIGFAWIDDCHEMAHVEREVEMLLPKMKTGGVMTFHDVYGSCDLQQVVTRWGGYCLDIPRLGRAGGLGILQVR